jgi:hypothetical protein
VHQNKKISKWTAKLLIGIMSFCIFSPVTYAQSGLSCKDLNEGQTKYIVTILEEEIAAPTSEKEESQEQGIETLSCIRKTTCEQKEKGEGDKKETVTVCESTYVGLKECNPGPQEFCQRVQAIIAQSGMELLMSYIGIIYRWAAGVIGIVSVIYLVWGGFMITAAQDDTSAIDKAKEKIMQSIAGLVLLFLSAVILYTINPNFFTL